MKWPDNSSDEGAAGLPLRMVVIVIMLLMFMKLGLRWFVLFAMTYQPVIFSKKTSWLWYPLQSRAVYGTEEHLPGKLAFESSCLLNNIYILLMQVK